MTPSADGFSLDRYRIAALALAAALLFAAATDYIPAFIDAQGRVFGLFQLDIYKDALHVASGLWALASTLSRRSAVFFLRVFGTLYFLDGVMGVFTGAGYLDLSIVIDGIRNTSLLVKVLSSLPHLALGALGIAVGWSPWGARPVTA
ncbi:MULTISPECIES: DUF4383 domain-containing protein [unclassified Bradyrhizobium]|uniref:DUF4383 domain-containing protein n=1 Tax=unclassified Bradyrhizobium TaxID=2631580 RepID=UPI0028E2B9FA|nr:MULTISPECIES: DUF4383 domain-containing protein [unclassified Bradyrhizobium]